MTIFNVADILSEAEIRDEECTVIIVFDNLLDDVLDTNITSGDSV